MVKIFSPYTSTEDNFQVSVARYLDSMRLLWTHVANERKTDVKVSVKGIRYTPAGSKLKAKGVKRGVPDVLIFEPRGPYHGMAIELKVGKNKPSPDQQQFIDDLRRRGYKTVITWSLDELMFEVDRYLKCE